MSGKLRRREFLQVSAIAAAGVLAQACAKTPTEAPAGPTPAPKDATKAPAPAPGAAKEAPMLSDMVKTGAIPAVDERLPAEPLVHEMVERLGQYGGSWTFMQIGDVLSHWGMVNYVENFLKWKRDTSGHRPNVVTSWEWNDMGTEVTLHFRKGIKWSDGAPLTVDDWMFWWFDLVEDEKVNVGRQTGTFVAGEPMQLDKIDDYTIKLSFAAPNPLFLEVMCRGTGNRATSWQVVPSHYLKQFHYKYNKDLKDTDTEDLLDRFTNRRETPGVPHFGPWLTKELRLGERGIMERNPYYWKTDPEGNQLPYMDGVEVRIAQSPELISLSAVAGELDFQVRQLEVKDVPVLMDNQQAGNYEVRMWKVGDTSKSNILFNYCYADKSITDLMWNQKFRQAMSWAMNRDRINDIVFLGLAKSRQMAMFSGAPEYQTPRGKKVLEDWESLCRDHEPETAKKLLDEIGVVDVNGDGFREKPDGSPLELMIDIDIDDKASVEVHQLVKEDYAEVGLNLVLNVIDGTVYGQRIDACESMFFNHGDASASGLFIAQSHWAPVENTGYCIGGRPYGAYYQSGGKEGIPAPPGSFLEKLQIIYGEAILIVDPEKRTDRLLDGYQVHIDDGPIQIGTVGDTNSPVVVKNNLHNVVPMGVIGSWVFGFPGTADPEQWFKTEE